MRYSFYRYHIIDPIYFRRDIRVTIQQIGIILPENIEAFTQHKEPIYKAGPGLIEIDKSQLRPYQLFEREDDWSSCAYFYLDKPENGLNQLPSEKYRTEGL